MTNEHNWASNKKDLHKKKKHLNKIIWFSRYDNYQSMQVVLHDMLRFTSIVGIVLFFTTIIYIGSRVSLITTSPSDYIPLAMLLLCLLLAIKAYKYWTKRITQNVYTLLIEYSPMDKNLYNRLKTLPADDNFKDALEQFVSNEFRLINQLLGIAKKDSPKERFEKS